jgi:hypothetical protein
MVEVDVVSIGVFWTHALLNARMDITSSANNTLLLFMNFTTNRATNFYFSNITKSSKRGFLTLFKTDSWQPKVDQGY